MGHLSGDGGAVATECFYLGLPTMTKSHIYVAENLAYWLAQFGTASKYQTENIATAQANSVGWASK